MTFMEIKKSSRHAKITGDFAEHLVLYWLSKYGFECARIDHTGIDLIAGNPDEDIPMGVSVKSRCRLRGQEESSVLIPDGRHPQGRRGVSCFPVHAPLCDRRGRGRVDTWHFGPTADDAEILSERKPNHQLGHVTALAAEVLAEPRHQELRSSLRNAALVGKPHA